MEKDVKTHWAALLKCFFQKQGGKTFAPEVYRFKNEVKTSRYIHGASIIQMTFQRWYHSLPKAKSRDKEVSTKMRNQGNDFFKSSDTVVEAACLYTMAIYTAPSMSQALALAHANRAAAMYKLGEYEAAYDDCECALQIGHPKTDVILLRQATSARALQRAAELEQCLTKLEKMDLTTKFPQIVEYRKDLENITKPNDVSEDAEQKFKDIPEKKQKMFRSPDCGRYIVAEEPIAADETIMWEDAFAFVQVADRLENEFEDELTNVITHACHNCAKDDIIPFPCYSCRNVPYCSIKCRIQHEPIHSIECNGYKANLFHQIGIGHLAFRSLLVLFDGLLKEVSSLTRAGKMYKKAEEIWPVILQTARDGELMGLCTNLELWKDRKEDIVQYALTASMLCCYLRIDSDFFMRTKNERSALMLSDSEWEIVIVALLIRLISQMICNAHTIEGLIVERPYTGTKFKQGEACQSVRQGNVFAAIYPRISLYNHACEPSFRNRFDGKRLFAIARTDILRGEEIFNCYGPDFRKESREVRQATLKQQYGFTCKCRWCTDENDSAFFNNNFIVCKRKSCRKQFIPVSEEARCPQCDMRISCRLDEVIFHSSILENSVRKYEFLYDMLLKVERSLPKHTMLRYASVIVVLLDFMQCPDMDIKQNEKLNVRMFKLAVDAAQTIEHIHGVKSLQYVMSAVTILDLLAYRKLSNLPGIPINYEVNKIQESFEIISGRWRKKLDDYFKNCVTV